MLKININEFPKKVKNKITIKLLIMIFINGGGFQNFSNYYLNISISIKIIIFFLIETF